METFNPLPRDALTVSEKIFHRYFLSGCDMPEIAENFDRGWN